MGCTTVLREVGGERKRVITDDDYDDINSSSNFVSQNGAFHVAYACS